MTLVAKSATSKELSEIGAADKGVARKVDKTTIDFVNILSRMDRNEGSIVKGS